MISVFKTFPNMPSTFSSLPYWDKSFKNRCGRGHSELNLKVVKAWGEDCWSVPLAQLNGFDMFALHPRTR